MTGSTIGVAIDGTDVLRATVAALKPTALAGFSGGTGGRNDVHAVSDVRVVTGRTAVPATGWRMNGSAVPAGTGFRLTSAVAGQAGTVIHPTPVPTAHLRANFTTQIGGGTGADGLTFMLLDPARNAPSSVGRSGSGLGFAGLTGVAVGLCTYPQGTVASNNFAGLLTGTSTGATFVATSTAIPQLRNGKHEVSLSVDAGRMTVSIDGKPVFDTAVTGIPANALIGFSGATGGLTDIHAVSDVHIVY